eukprot:4322902-Ditylum_brightwellii.AAC.1
MAGEEPLTNEKWKVLDDDAKPMVSITVCYDMGWQKREHTNKKKAKHPDCPKNHDSSSKAMESAVALTLTIK